MLNYLTMNKSLSMIKTPFVILFMSIRMLFASESSSDTTKSLIFDIFYIEKEFLKKYEKGYIVDRVFRSREFQQPINFIPIEMRYGFGYNIGGGAFGLGKLNDNWMSYDSDVEKFDGGNLSSRIGHQLDIDILKSNLAYYFFGNSWLDMHSGINIKYSSLLLSSKIPEEWNNSNESWRLNSKFSAKIFELGWSQSLILQWFDSWFSSYRYTYGYAFSQFYEDENSLNGLGPAQSFTIGARYIINSDLDNRFTVGVDFKYTSTNIKKINDKNDITPIKGFKIQNAGLYLTASAFFGGEKSKGDTGKKYYFTRDFISAKRLLEEFINENPNHANILRAKKLIIESERKIPYQLIKQGMSFDERRETNQAVEKYLLAKSIADTLLKGVINERLREIAFREVEKADRWLNMGLGDSALAHVSSVAGWYPQVNNHIKRIKVGNLMNKGEGLYKIGLHRRALAYFDQALNIDPGLTFEIGIFKQKIAHDLITVADSLRDENSINFVLYALEETKRLTGGLSNSNEKILQELKRKISIKEGYEIRQRMNAILLKEKNIEKSKRPIVAGMTISQVEEIMGPPNQKITDSSEKKNQLWIYEFDRNNKVILTFVDYRLFRIEEDL